MPTRISLHWSLCALAAVCCCGCDIPAPSPEVAAQRKAQQEARALARGEQQHRRERYGDLITARAEAERLLKGLVRYPEEADISFLLTMDPVEHETGGRWVFGGEVVAKNAVGVRTRYKWGVKLERRQDARQWWWENVETVLWDEHSGVVAVSGTGGRKDEPPADVPDGPSRPAAEPPDQGRRADPPVPEAEVRRQAEAERKADAYLTYAKKLVARGETEKAKERLREIVEKFPETKAEAEARTVLKGLK